MHKPIVIIQIHPKCGTHQCSILHESALHESAGAAADYHSKSCVSMRTHMLPLAICMIEGSLHLSKAAEVIYVALAT